MTEAQRKEFFEIRKCLDGLVVKIAEAPAEVNANMTAIRIWTPAPYAVGDVRMYEGNPYKCVQPHDSTTNPDWTPAVASLWMQYHGTTRETARPYIAPTGAHDMYKAGEWMIWTDGLAYPCIIDTTYSPNDYRAAWGEPETI